MIDSYEGVHVHGGFRHMGTGPFFPGYEGNSSKCFYLGGE
jgi:hypothetical protein